MDVRRLQMLLELSRLGSMHEVADAMGTTTSSVSQGIAALAKDVGSPLLAPDGRRVRLTPAGRRLAEHAVTILAAVDAARLDLDPTSEPIGVLRVAGFASAIRRSLLPAIDDLRRTNPGIEVHVLEYEPLESFDLLARDDVDLALVYDYDLAPVDWRADHEVTPLWDLEWGVGVPTEDRHLGLADLADRDWIVNSRNTADEVALRTLASRAGFTPRVVHRIDSLELVDDLVVAGRGVGLLPRGRASRRGVSVVRLKDPSVFLRAYAVTRRGRDNWPPLRAVVDRLAR
ncbi:DNA-binding transcriptional LysR family regulator [Nocardioides sp. BE266]|uniref:LysR family transcriptional regulator n=1 Tax=Nocardioides sp. BE266 TaxID=2817725 RepID=UPI002862AFA6|nr:LysR substrate-binding domain-containing protein [Nocardioides sp. BE266]MDR7251315.1 DNA-binding transcriptional LysR family regulator [Nocardioides sp. BE266]